MTCCAISVKEVDDATAPTAITGPNRTPRRTLHAHTLTIH